METIQHMDLKMSHRLLCKPSAQPSSISRGTKYQQKSDGEKPLTEHARVMGPGSTGCEGPKGASTERWLRNSQR